MKNSKLTGAVIATTVASLFLASPLLAKAKAGEEGKDAKVKCMGVNSCKGKGSCNGADNSCAGKNGCKGKGWKTMKSEEACIAKGGKVMKEKM